MYFYGWQFKENPKKDRDPYAVNPAESADFKGTGATGYHGFTFGDVGAKKVVILGSTRNASAKVEIRDGSATGAVIASVDFPDTSGEVTGKVFNLYGAAVKRARHLYFTYPDELFSLESVQFIKARTDPSSAYAPVQAEDFDYSDDGYAAELCADGSEIGTSVHVTDPNNVSFIYKGLDFGATEKNLMLRVRGKGDGTRDVRVSTSANNNTTIKLGSPDDSEYGIWYYPIGSESGRRDIDFYFMPGTDAWIDWFEFIEMPNKPIAVNFSSGGTRIESLADAAGKQLETEILINESLLPQGASARAIVAVYDGKGRLMSIDSCGTGMFYFDMPDDTTGMSVKVFLLDDNFVPLAEHVAISHA
jgi:hypothetical protein